MGIEFGQSQRQSQKLAVSPRQMQGLRLLSKSLPELRAEILDEMARNPAIDDVERTLETNLSEVERQRDASADAMPDYPEDDWEGERGFDEEAAERRQAFFDSQVGE